MRSEDFIKSQLALMGWRYGKDFGGHIPATLIMQTIANRVRLGWSNWMDAIDRIPVYSYLNVGEEPTGFPVVWDAAFVKILHAVDGIYDGSAEDKTSGAVYWCDLGKITRQWFIDSIVRKSSEHPRCGDMNSLTFFR